MASSGQVATSITAQEPAAESSPDVTGIDDGENRASMVVEGSKTAPEGRKGPQVVSRHHDHVQILSQSPALLFESFLALPESRRAELVGLLENTVAGDALSRADHPGSQRQESGDKQDLFITHEDNVSEAYKLSSQRRTEPVKRDRTTDLLNDVAAFHPPTSPLPPVQDTSIENRQQERVPKPTLDNSDTPLPSHIPAPQSIENPPGGYPGYGSSAAPRPYIRSPSPGFPKRGNTRIPARLVSTSAIIHLGYPFEEEVRI